jgi:quinone-modifying oxidoreductase, subunit QmoC
MELKTKVNMKYQKDAKPEWVQRVTALPGCERLMSCIQCGTCSGSCPLSIYMDYTPRRIINLVREGFREDALASQTIWLCASCYACSVNCPQDIHITDIMYTLKREAIKSRLYPKRFAIPVLAREFHNMVARRGRSSEFWLVLRMALKSNPKILFSMIGTGWKLVRTGRMSLAMEKINRVHELPRDRTGAMEVR